MDSRIALLREFSRGFIPGTVKVETEQHGFAYLEQLLADGVSLNYGELTAVRLLHKYKLTRVSDSRMDELLRAHLAKTCNVCRYFAAGANDVFCFNLDNNHKSDNTRVIPELALAVELLGESLRALELEPLVVASGRGYHVWCRLAEPVANERLYDFMLRAAVRTLMSFQPRGLDHRKIKFNFYPDRRIHDLVSLRLFGSDHARNRVFSFIRTPAGLLSETDSWSHFEDFMANRTISLARFEAASAALQLAQ